MSQSNCKVRVAIDLSFDDLMNDKVDFSSHQGISAVQFLKITHYWCLFLIIVGNQQVYQAAVTMLQP
jgi:hypothetical protein